MLVLMGILSRLMRPHPGRGVESWLLGLSFILVETVAFAVARGSPNLQRSMGVVSLDGYVMAAASFAWAARGEDWAKRMRFPVFLLPALPLLAVCSLYGLGMNLRAPYLWIAGLSFGVGLVCILRIWRGRPKTLLTLAAVHAGLWLPMIVFAEAGRPEYLAYWGLCVLYLLTAYSFRRLVHRGRMGGIVIIAGFVVWSASFALHPWLNGEPVYGLLLDQIGNRQKFLVIIGMLLVLLENETERSEQQALTDSLTGLPNRRLLDDRLVHELERARRFATPLGLFVIDLNGFKEINDSCGHATGDKALQLTAQQLKARIRGSDTVARMGGDEFCVLMADAGENDCGRIAQMLREAVETVPLPEGCPGPMTASIGWALFPRDSGTAESLRNLADARMYEEKRALAADPLRGRYGSAGMAGLEKKRGQVSG
jgi:diguanylate cyclase (GGDEF)-like protein